MHLWEWWHVPSQYKLDGKREKIFSALIDHKVRRNDFKQNIDKWFLLPTIFQLLSHIFQLANTHTHVRLIVADFSCLQRKEFLWKEILLQFISIHKIPSLPWQMYQCSQYSYINSSPQIFLFFFKVVSIYIL